MAPGICPARTASSWNPAGAKILPLYSSAERMSTISAEPFLRTAGSTSRIKVARIDLSALVATKLPSFGAGTSIYIQLSASPEIKYKLDENQPTLEIEFDNTIPARIDFTFSSVDLNFSSEEMEEISKFIDKKTDMLVLSIQIYDHSKTLIHIVNKVFVNE